MNRTLVPWECTTNVFCLIPRRVLASLILLIACAVASLAQSASQPTNVTMPFSVRATHLMGFAGAPNNANGTLSIEDSALQFQKSGKPAVELKIVSVEDIFLGEQSKQVGGLPMTLSKAATPYGGGRVVSLFAHKKYDSLTLEYVDTNGGVHGAIFQMAEGRAAQVRQELVTRGVRTAVRADQSAEPSTAETSHENQ